jgi:hypothetical protein
MAYSYTDIWLNQPWTTYESFTFTIPPDGWRTRLRAMPYFKFREARR